jgi:uncharacterized lipoprotein YddW (UPF0748 family)
MPAPLPPPPPPPPADPATIWIELGEGLARFRSAAEVTAFVDTAAALGFQRLIVDVKGRDGGVLFDSRRAPRIDPGFDYFGAFKAAASSRGMQVCARFPVLVEGDTKSRKGPAYDNPSWQMVIQTPEGELVPQAAMPQPGNELLANICLPEVQQYELSVIGDLLNALRPDAVVLDDLRFYSLAADLSDSTRVRFEAWSGLPPAEWPQSVLDSRNPRHPMWLSFRTGVICEFVKRTASYIRESSPGTRVYLGVPAVYEASLVGGGVNWAHTEFKPPYWYAGPKIQQAGLAGLVDGILVMTIDVNPRALQEVMRGARNITRNHVPISVLVRSDAHRGKAARFRECLQVIRAFGAGLLVTGKSIHEEPEYRQIVKEEIASPVTARRGGG